MKPKITVLLAALLLSSSISSVIYAAQSSCTPEYQWLGDDIGLCPGIYKRSRWNVCVSSGSQGQICRPMTTSGNGGCGYTTDCSGNFDGWRDCWPTFYAPVVSSGCWRQTVQDSSANCTAYACDPTGSHQFCTCLPGASTVYSVGSGPAYCNGC